MQLCPCNSGCEILGDIQLERSGALLFQRHAAHLAGGTGGRRVVGSDQRLLLPLFLLERVVSAIPSPEMVHPVPDHSGMPVALVGLLHPRRSIQNSFPPEMGRTSVGRRIWYRFPQPEFVEQIYNP